MLKKIFTLFLLYTSLLLANSGEFNFTIKPYVQNVSTDGITVLWETSKPSSGVVEFGEAKYNSNNALLDNITVSEEEMYFHAVRLNDLKAETKYFYKVIAISGKDTLEYEIATFMTAINSERPVTFAVFGDSQQQKDKDAWENISKMALSERPNFGLIVGDLVDRGGQTDQWKTEFLARGHSFMKNIPLFAVVGNHDIINDAEAINFNKFIKHPGSVNYYTFKNGNVQFFIMDSNQDMEPGSSQYIWLEDELAKSKATWKIAAHHHAPYSSDSDDYGNTETAQPLDGDPNFINIIPLYEKYNVDMVFYGHIHSYERTWPLLGKKVNDEGIVYIQCGGAGGNLEYSGVIKSWFSAKVKSDHHFCLVSVDRNKLYLNAIDYDGKLFDQYVIDKSGNISVGKAEKKMLSAPVLKYSGDKFMDRIEITIVNYNSTGEIRYTTDGSRPDKNSILYSEPLTVEESLKIRAIIIAGDEASKLSEKIFTKTLGQESVEVDSPRAGLEYNYYLGQDWVFLPDFKNLETVKKGVTREIKIEGIKDREDQFAITYRGYIYIDKNGVYDFYLLSDDGAKLFIDDELVVDNNGSHSPRTRSGNIGLKAGYHKFYLEYFEDCEGEELKIFYKSENFPKQLIPENVFFY